MPLDKIQKAKEIINTAQKVQEMLGDGESKNTVKIGKNSTYISLGVLVLIIVGMVYLSEDKAKIIDGQNMMEKRIVAELTTGFAAIAKDITEIKNDATISRLKAQGMWTTEMQNCYSNALRVYLSQPDKYTYPDVQAIKKLYE
jgi:hypothetical protein